MEPLYWPLYAGIDIPKRDKVVREEAINSLQRQRALLHSKDEHGEATRAGLMEGIIDPEEYVKLALYLTLKETHLVLGGG